MPRGTTFMREIVENIGLIIAAFTAIYGINAWRREFRGKKEYELAEEVLTLFYDCKDRIRMIRSPFAQIGEGSSRQKRSDETTEESQLLDRAYVVYERYEKHQEYFSKLFALRYRFMAIFGKDNSQPFIDLQYAINEIFLAAQLLPDYWMRQGRVPMTDDQFKKHLEQMSKHESIFWGTFSENDTFNNRIEEIVLHLENTCSIVLHPTKICLPWQKLKGK